MLFTLVGCSSESNENGSTDTTTTTSTTTTTIGPLPPELRLPDRARAEIGQVFSDAIVAADPNGDETVIEIAGDSPDGFTPTTNARGRITGFQWQPETAGVAVTQPMTLLARHPRDKSGDLLVAMGDSVAAGFGRDRTDFVGSDACFRSESDAYGVLVTESLIDAGSFSDDAEVIIAACSGATASSLGEAPVSPTDADGNSAGDTSSQLDIAVRSNPTVITLTIGAAELLLFDADPLIASSTESSGGVVEPVIDDFYFNGLLSSFEVDLHRVLDELTTSTDAHVVVTTWYDPTAAIPIGVEGCKGACFRRAMDELVSRANARIIEVASAQPEGRVSIARLDGDADVWEAANGFGIDALRDRLGPLQGLADSFTGGSSSTCADDGGPTIELVSTLDCVHPNSNGHEAIAAVVTEVLLSI